MIVDAICEAWDKMSADFPEPTAEEDESRVNGALHNHLLLALQEQTLLSSLVRNVTRGSEQYSYDGTKHEFRPDLNFHLTARDIRFPLVGECKIIDASTHRTIARYKRDGIDRFTSGNYGWACVEALMVAYVRDASDAETSLAAATGSAPERWVGVRSTAHYRSVHARGFQYVGRDPREECPGDIGIIHIWLPAPAAGSP
ncbi:hypothetical protein [Salinarimonas soli]|uniref:Restriction endonuclease n=1 Tax=Salinarimonas soli TaxID=1638099 RepID=A0A5B2VBN3_9HYPH|nr:hypothetical protein [Salinarimonas soli]KAA2235860.1 hypothetical protein F0L46_17620 [Salinarimonas soli]